MVFIDQNVNDIENNRLNNIDNIKQHRQTKYERKELRTMVRLHCLTEEKKRKEKECYNEHKEERYYQV